MLYIGMALVVVPFIIVVISFIMNNYKSINVSELIIVVMVMLCGVALSLYANNRVVTQTNALVTQSHEQGYNDGIEAGYEEGSEYTKVTSEIYSIGYDSIEIKYYDGTIHHFAFDPEEYTEEDNYGLPKTYMDYRTITSSTASQTKLNNLPEVYTDDYGFRRIDDYYLCALGSYYGQIGDMFLVELSSGRQFIVVKGDSKSDEHTDSSHRYQKYDGSVLEFIVDSDILVSNGCTGDCSPFNFEGSILSIQIIGHYDF